MSPQGQPAFRRLARACPRCGAREPTLGSSCPACGAPYEPRSWVDHASDVGEDWPLVGGVAGMLIAGVLALVSLLVSAVLAAPRALLAGLGRVARRAARRWSG